MTAQRFEVTFTADAEVTKATEQPSTTNSADAGEKE